jgi:hypothetical protein
MKKLLICLVISIPFLSYSQIVIDPNIQWQQFIPLITGGKSITIDHILIQGDPAAFGYYKAMSGEYNLSQGILMTSGTVAPGVDGPLGPNNLPNAGLDNDTWGHPFAEQIAGGSANSFNASVIEFDFSSPVQDTLQMSYLFGSEEYKEYVGSVFNDVFGFFITSGPGITSPVNIALIPGTATPIAINSVNHMTNSSYYIDNDSPPGNILQYDGMVRLTTEAFPVEPNQTYHILLLVSDIGDGIFDSGVFLELIQGTQELCGQILYEGLPAGPGYVELIGYRIHETDTVVLDTAFTDPSGNFSFNTVDYGGYILRSVLDPVDYPLSYPVYLENSVVWNMADIQYMPTLDTTCSLLNHRELLVGTGPGVINGTIVNDNLVKYVGLINGKSDTYIFAFDENDDLKAVSKMDNQGHYELTGLDEGTYTLYVDYLGYSMIDTNFITLGPGHYDHTANYLTKNKEKHIIRLLEEPIPSDEFTAIAYPNPSDGDFTLVLHSPSFMRDLNIEVADLRGRIIYSQKLSNVAEGQSFYRFDLAESVPSGGMYIIQLFNGSCRNTSKILINK